MYVTERLAVVFVTENRKTVSFLNSDSRVVLSPNVPVPQYVCFTDRQSASHRVTESLNHS
jgi:hypothetical protein